MFEEAIEEKVQELVNDYTLQEMIKEVLVEYDYYSIEDIADKIIEVYWTYCKNNSYEDVGKAFLHWVNDEIIPKFEEIAREWVEDDPECYGIYEEDYE